MNKKTSPLVTFQFLFSGAVLFFASSFSFATPAVSSIPALLKVGDIEIEPYNCKNNYSICFNDLIPGKNAENNLTYDFKWRPDQGSILQVPGGHRFILSGYLGSSWGPLASANFIDLSTGKVLDLSSLVELKSWPFRSRNFYVFRDESKILTVWSQGLSEVDLKTGVRTKYHFSDHSDWFQEDYALKLSEDESTGAILSDNQLYIFDVPSRKVVFSKTIPAPDLFSYEVNGLALSADGHLIAALIKSKEAGQTNDQIFVWDRASQKSWEFPLLPVNNPEFISITADGSLLWKAEQADRIVFRLSRLSDGAPVRRVLSLPENDFGEIVYDGKGHLLLGGHLMDDTVLVDIFSESVIFPNQGVPSLQCELPICYRFRTIFSDDKKSILSYGGAFRSEGDTGGGSWFIQRHDLDKKLTGHYAFPIDIFAKPDMNASGTTWPQISAPDESDIFMWKNQTGFYWNLKTGLKKIIHANSDITSMHLLKDQGKIVTLPRYGPIIVTNSN